MHSLKHAFRTLAKTPFVTTVAIISLALGIGANAAIFSIFDQLLLRSVPVPNPERLVNLGAPGPKPGSQSCNQAGDCDQVFSYPMFRDLEEEQTSFTGIAAHRSFGANLAYEGQTENGAGMLVSGSYFPVLDIQPALGRLLTPADDQSVGAHFVVVLSHDYWQTRMGSDPGALNGTLMVNGQPMTVVGVAPKGFRGTTLGIEPDIFVPLTMRELMEPFFSQGFDNRRSYWAYLFARLRPEVTVEQARAQVGALYQGIINEVEAPLQSGMTDQTLERFRAKEILMAEGRQGQSQMNSEAGTPLILLFSITGIVLLIACANIANLLLARGAHRGQEMAIRGSLGASRSQLLRQLLTESFLLAAAGGLASLLVASWTMGLVASLLPSEASGLILLELSPTAVLFVGILVLGTGLLFGLYPAIHSTRPDLVTILKDSSGQPSGARSASRFRTILATAQIALSMALLVGAGLFIKSLANVSRVDLGIATENVIVFGVAPILNGYEAERSMALFQRMEEELAALPGVTGVSAAMVPILAGNNWGQDVSVEGFEGGPDVDQNSRYNGVGPGYFGTLGIPLLAGREFTPADAEGAPAVTIINEAFARKFGLDPRQAVGKRMAANRSGDLDTEIVGIVQDAAYSDVKQAAPPLFFSPYRQNPGIGFIHFYVRTGMDPAQIMGQVPSVVNRLDPNLPVNGLKTLDQQARENVFLDRMIGTLSTAFAALATLLAAVGLYGVLAYSVAQRTREIGLRMALGAAGSTVRAMILRRVILMTLVGGVLGLAGGLALGRGAQSLLFEMEGHDPLVLLASALLLAGVSLAAGYAPALRASRVDPMQALRYE
jgi:predicted permease